MVLRKRELTEFLGILGEFCEKLGEFIFAHKIEREGEREREGKIQSLLESLNIQEKGLKLGKC